MSSESPQGGSSKSRGGVSPHLFYPEGRGGVSFRALRSRGGVSSELSIFVDASGGQGGYSKYYGITLVFHNQESSIEDCLEKHRLWLLDRDLDDIPLHTGPLMTGHDDYDGMEDVAHAVHGAVEYTLSENGLMYRKTCASEFMLAQAADLLCTLELTAFKYKNGEATRTDEKFFGSASTFCLTRDGASPMLRRAPSWLLLWILAPVLPVLRGARGPPVVILGFFAL